MKLGQVARDILNLIEEIKISNQRISTMIDRWNQTNDPEKREKIDRLIESEKEKEEREMQAIKELLYLLDPADK